MIKSIHIENIQSHTDTMIEFSQGINVIVGESDKGKTAIMRALSWVIQNRPLGDSFRTWGKDSMRVSLEVEDSKIIRSKSKKENVYLLQDQKFSAIGHDTPKQINDVLKISPLNIQTQFEGPFLIASSETPGKVAKYLNEIVNLEDIDIALTNIAQFLKQDERSLKEKQAIYDQYEIELITYNWLELAEEEIIRLETLEEEIITKTKDCEQLNDIISSLEDFAKKSKQFDNIISATDLVKETISLNKQISDTINLKNSLSSLNTKINQNETIINDLSEILKFSSEVDELYNLRKKLSKFERESLELRNFIKNGLDYQSKAEEINRDLQELHFEFHKLQPDICPLCGKKWQKES